VSAVKPNDAASWVVLEVLAGAYKGKRLEQRALLSHVVGLDARGHATLVLCRGVQLESLCDERRPGLPSCARCKDRLARWNRGLYAVLERHRDDQTKPGGAK
jgi:hypothetical protein